MFHISTAMPCQDLVQTNHGKGVYMSVPICFCMPPTLYVHTCMCILEVCRSSGMCNVITANYFGDLGNYEEQCYGAISLLKPSCICPIVGVYM